MPIIDPMACKIRSLGQGTYEIRCTPSKIVHYRFDPMDGRWAVDEDPEHYRFHNQSEAQDRGRLLCGDPELMGQQHQTDQCARRHGDR